MEPEFTIEQIRQFVAKGFTSVSARYVKAMLLHYDAKNQANGHDTGERQLTIPDVSGLLPFDEAALKREYNLETYGKMTDWDRKQLWKWFVEKLKGNNR